MTILQIYCKKSAYPEIENVLACSRHNAIYLQLSNFIRFLLFRVRFVMCVIASYNNDNNNNNNNWY